MKDLLKSGCIVSLRNGYECVVVNVGSSVILYGIMNRPGVEKPMFFNVHDFYDDQLRYLPNMSYDIMSIRTPSIIHVHSILLWTRESGFNEIEECLEYISEEIQQIRDMI